MKGSENIITEEELFAAIAASIDKGLKAETEAECNDDDDNTYELCL